MEQPQLWPTLESPALHRAEDILPPAGHGAGGAWEAADSPCGSSTVATIHVLAPPLSSRVIWQTSVAELMLKYHCSETTCFVKLIVTSSTLGGPPEGAAAQQGGKAVHDLGDGSTSVPLSSTLREVIQNHQGRSMEGLGPEAGAKLEENLSRSKEADEKLEQGLGSEAGAKLEENLSRSQEADEKLEQDISRSEDACLVLDDWLLDQQSRADNDVAADLSSEKDRQAADLSSEKDRLAVDLSSEKDRLDADLSSEIGRLAWDASGSMQRWLDSIGSAMANIVGRVWDRSGMRTKEKGGQATDDIEQQRDSPVSSGSEWEVWFTPFTEMELPEAKVILSHFEMESMSGICFQAISVLSTAPPQGGPAAEVGFSGFGVASFPDGSEPAPQGAASVYTVFESSLEGRFSSNFITLDPFCSQGGAEHVCFVMTGEGPEEKPGCEYLFVSFQISLANLETGAGTPVNSVHDPLESVNAALPASRQEQEREIFRPIVRNKN
eukprot:gene26908-4524_t